MGDYKKNVFCRRSNILLKLSIKSMMNSVNYVISNIRSFQTVIMVRCETYR